MGRTVTGKYPLLGERSTSSAVLEQLEQTISQFSLLPQLPCRPTIHLRFPSDETQRGGEGARTRAVEGIEDA